MSRSALGSSLCLPELRYCLCFPCTVLLQHGADANIRNTDGKSALDLAEPSAKAVLTEEQEPCGVLEGAGHVPSSLGRLPGSGQVLLLRSSPSAMQRENERIAARPRSFSHPPAYVPSFLKASNFLNEASVPQDQDAAL
ncbi:tankyrase-1 isoform X1, partial [Tachysurus ichikawai]